MAMKSAGPVNAATTTPPFRSPFEAVIVSTLPHFLPLIFIAGCEGGAHTTLYAVYSAVVAISSLLSIVWHMQVERKNVWFWLDYLFAAAWTILDIVVAFVVAPLHVILTVIFLNVLVFVCNQLADLLSNKGIIPYETGHAAWHVLSWVKAVFVAYLVGCRYSISCRVATSP